MCDSVIFANTRGFQVKQGEINTFAQVHKPAVLLIAEHFQSNTFHLQINGYVLAACYCRDVREKGGVAIFVRADVEYENRKDLDYFNVKKQFETRSIEIPSRNLVVTVVYRPPSGSIKLFHSALESVLKIYNKTSSRGHLMGGDFNVDNKQSNSTERIVQDNNFKFMFASMTHVNGKCLDNFIVDFVPINKEIMSERLSDHNCIRLILPNKNELKSTFSGLGESWEFQRIPASDVLADSLAARESFRNMSNQSTLESLINRNLLPLKPLVPSSKASQKNPISAESVCSTVHRTQPASHFSTEKKQSELPKPKEPQTTSHAERLSEMEAMLTRCLTKDDFLELFVSKLAEKVKDKVVETLSESLKEAKGHIEILQDKVSSLESQIAHLEDQITL